MKDISRILHNIGFISAAGSAATEAAFFAQWGEDNTAYVANLTAAPGKDARAVTFGAGVTPARLDYALGELARRGFETGNRRREGGRVVLRVTAGRYADVGAMKIGGGQQGPDPTWLNFTMPEGGTVTLNRIGNPTVVDAPRHRRLPRRITT